MRYFLAMFVFLAMSIESYAASYYYSVSGSYGGDCTVDDPCTVEKFNDTTFADGDTAYFKRGDRWTSGEYLGQGFDIGDKTLNIDAYGTGDKPTWDGDDFSPAAIRFSSSYTGTLIMKNIRVEGYGGADDAALDFWQLYSVTLDGVDFDGHAYSSGNLRKSGIRIARIYNNVTIQNCDWRNCFHKKYGIGYWRSKKGLDQTLCNLTYGVGEAPTGGKQQGQIIVQDSRFEGAESDLFQVKGCNGYPTTGRHYFRRNYFGANGENPVDGKNSWFVFENNIVNSGNKNGGNGGPKGAIASFYNKGSFGGRPQEYIVRYNIFKNYDRRAVSVSSDPDTEIYGNLFWRVAQAISASSNSSMKVYNNIYWNDNPVNGDSDDKMHDYAFEFNRQSNLDFMRNSIYMGNGDLTSVLYMNGSSGSSNKIEQNIFQSPDNGAILVNYDGGTGATLDRNQYYGGTGTWINFNGKKYNSGEKTTWNDTPYASNEDFADPLFSDTAAGNLVLQSGSPARDTGAILDSPYTYGINWDRSDYFPSEDSATTVVEEFHSSYGTNPEKGAILYGTSGGGGDSTPTVISNFSPADTLPGSTTQTTVSVKTNEAATCQYNETGGLAFDDPGQTEFTTTGGTIHFFTKTGLTPDSNSTIYIRCEDGAGNANTTDFSGTVNVGTIDNNLLNATTYLTDSNNFHVSYPASNAWDNDLTNEPGSVAGDGIDGGWIIFDLGVDYNLTSAKIFGDDRNNWYCTEWEMQVGNSAPTTTCSDDTDCGGSESCDNGICVVADDWSTVFTGQNCFGFQWYSQDVSGNSGRYVRFNITGNTTYHALQFVELWLEGEPSASQTEIIPVVLQDR